MSGSTLYDEDILLWSEQQAEVIRRLRETARNLPNDLDIENVAEEIESVGRSELAAVESYVELILLHLIKLVVEPMAASARHWRTEIGGFHSNLGRRYVPLMQRRIDMDQIWTGALRQLRLGYDDSERETLDAFPGRSPVALEDLLGTTIDLAGLIGRLRASLRREER